MEAMTLQSPAKLNLYLRVTGRRKDGYHGLYTLFHRISLCDTLRLRKSAGGLTLKCSHPGLRAAEDNIVTRAWHLLKREFPQLRGVSVTLTKRIPLGAGLGGGSSNAAAFLLGMRRLYRLPLPLPRLMTLGRRLGADVPFFLAGVNQAVGTGRGDRIRPRPARKKQWFLLILSSKPLSTAAVFRVARPEATGRFLTKVSHAVTMLCDFLDREKGPDAAGFMENDLEKAAFRVRPSLQRRFLRIKRLGISDLRMSGSGPTLFALFPSRWKARQYMMRLRDIVPAEELKVVSTI